MTATWLTRRARALWDRIPGTPLEVLLLWVLGLALGMLAFRTILALPSPVALACWAAAVGLGLLLARRAEPVLWEEADTAGRGAAVAPVPGQAPPPEPARVRPLLDLVPIPGGTFRMGSPPATQAQIADYARRWGAAFGGKPEDQLKRVREWLEREQPDHRVYLSPILMGRAPVTRGQWRAVLPDVPEEWSKTGDDDDLPATHIDWPQSLTFCNARSQREGLTPCYRSDKQGESHWDRAADGYRLPTEAEWEYGCRAGAATQWFWGDDPEEADAHAWYDGNSGGKLRPVRGKAANPWGLHDMAGLVWEWCWDRYGAYPEDGQTPPRDPVGPLDGGSRVVRGGSFAYPPDALRSAGRDFFWPDFRGVDLGLRCVRSRARQP